MKHTMILLAGSALLLAGCGRGNDPAKETPPDAGTAATPAAIKTVTLHAKDMTERQALT